MKPRIYTGTYRYKLGYIASVFICVYLWLSPIMPHAQESITIAVASSFYQQALSISKHFEAQHHIQVRVVSGSTGRLYHQIKQGAPFDVFITAGTDFIPLLKAQNKVIGQGYLGLKVKDKWLTELQILQDKNIKTIALANPKAAPFGRAAKELLEQAKLWQIIQPKLVYAQNAMQAGMMVKQNLTDAGLIVTPQKANALAVIPYVAVLLSDHQMADAFFGELKP